MATRNDRTWVEISRSAVRYNLNAVQRLIGTVPIAPVIKANAYGHGLIELVKILRGQKIWGICVAYGTEALQLRRLGFRGRILVLSFWQGSELAELIRARIDLAVWNTHSLHKIVGLPVALRSRARLHIKLDSGTSRIGFLPGQLPKLRRQLDQANLRPVGLFSHLANSEEASTAGTKQQLIRFTTLYRQLNLDQGITKHLACTAAAMRYPEARFGLIRLGIGLYGLWPSEATKRATSSKYPRFRLHPVLVWKSRLSQVKTLTAGTAVGYGSTVIVQRSTTIGIVPVGYSDGYDRRLSGRGWVIVRGRRAPVIGRVSMNVMAVNLSRVRGAAVGDIVTLIGPGVTADDLSAAAGILNYELASRISALLPRQLVR